MQANPRERDAEWVARYLLTVLRWAPGALTRDDLVERVLEHAASAMGCHWQRSTAARRVRDALEILLEGDTPVISAGGGFKLAWRATREERAKAAGLIRRMASTLHRKADRIEAAPVPGDARQLELFAAGGRS